MENNCWIDKILKKTDFWHLTAEHKWYDDYDWRCFGEKILVKTKFNETKLIFVVVVVQTQKVVCGRVWKNEIKLIQNWSSIHDTFNRWTSSS